MYFFVVDLYVLIDNIEAHACTAVFLFFMRRVWWFMCVALNLDDDDLFGQCEEKSDAGVPKITFRLGPASPRPPTPDAQPRKM
jgi:hypothetical protein